MISRRSLLVLAACSPLVGCAALLAGGVAGIGGGVAYYKRDKLAQLYCNYISCKNGEAKLSELSELVYWRVVNAAKQAKEAGMTIQKTDIDELYESELQVAKHSLRDSGIRLVNDL